MKIYEVEWKDGMETDWVLANSADEVVPFLKEENEDCAAEGVYDGVTPKEIPESDWPEHSVTLHGENDSEGNELCISFKEFVEREVKSPEFELPTYIAGTMFQ